MYVSMSVKGRGALRGAGGRSRGAAGAPCGWIQGRGHGWGAPAHGSASMPGDRSNVGHRLTLIHVLPVPGFLNVSHPVGLGPKIAFIALETRL